MKKAAFFAFSLIFASVPALADSPQVRATARMLVTKHTVGDNMRVLIETETPHGYAIEPPSETTDFSPFELKRVESSPIARGKNRVRRTFILHVTVFEKGSLTFPSATVRWRSPEGKTGEVKTDPIAVEIVSVGKRPSDKNDIRPIKGPESFDRQKLWTSLGAILAGLLTLLLAAKIALRRFRRSPEDESTKPPQARVRLELDRLKDRDLASTGRAREHASGLADLLRRYVERRFGLAAMEKTTTELSDSLRGAGLDRSFIDKTRAILERLDLIKFAKEEPTRADLEMTEKSILAIVEETTPEEKKTDGKK